MVVLLLLWILFVVWLVGEVILTPESTEWSIVDEEEYKLLLYDGLLLLLLLLFENEVDDGKISDIFISLLFIMEEEEDCILIVGNIELNEDVDWIIFWAESWIIQPLDVSNTIIRGNSLTA